MFYFFSKVSQVAVDVVKYGLLTLKRYIFLATYYNTIFCVMIIYPPSFA